MNRNLEGNERKVSMLGRSIAFVAAIISLIIAAVYLEEWYVFAFRLDVEFAEAKGREAIASKLDVIPADLSCSSEVKSDWTPIIPHIFNIKYWTISCTVQGSSVGGDVLVNQIGLVDEVYPSHL